MVCTAIDISNIKYAFCFTRLTLILILTTVNIRLIVDSINIDVKTWCLFNVSNFING